MTSSGPLKCVYLMYRYIKVYGEAIYERFKGREEWCRGVSWDDVTWVMTSSGPLKYVYLMYTYIKV